eukprot:Lithocolla_globosa_v1_NODE_167_length_5524_cov_11.838362.p3 type:complete len:152 gc:universal NODE_167_length_5524_cov_11.838362:928-473(-)
MTSSFDGDLVTAFVVRRSRSSAGLGTFSPSELGRFLVIHVLLVVGNKIGFGVLPQFAERNFWVADLFLKLSEWHWQSSRQGDTWTNNMSIGNNRRCQFGFVRNTISVFFCHCRHNIGIETSFDCTNQCDLSVFVFKCRVVDFFLVLKVVTC